jgi:hypothetical protein
MPQDSQEQLADWEFFNTEQENCEIFLACKDGILDEWIRQRPGTRPNFWWLEFAPEKSRRRIGGIGDPIHEHLHAVGQVYEHGVPSFFVTSFDVAYYNGRARDVDGNIIKNLAGPQYKDGDFKGKAIDPNDPPVYESEAAYLKRHALLTDFEKQRLRKKDFKPAIVEEK